MQRLTARHTYTHTERDLGTLSPACSVFTKSLPSELREHHTKGGRESVTARREGGSRETRPSKSPWAKLI